jgi:hypothetical protein
MARTEKTVFISQRRSPSDYFVFVVYDNLTSHKYDVFLDYKSIGAGKFGAIIEANISARAHFLVVLTPSTLDRVKTAEDWVRKEIEMALKTKRNIVPLMIENFDFNSPYIKKKLAELSLTELAESNGLVFRPDLTEQCLERLRRVLDVPVEVAIHPLSPAAKEVSEEQKLPAQDVPSISKDDLKAVVFFEHGFAAETPDQKEKYFTKAIGLKPDFVEAFTNRAAARFSSGDMEGATKDWIQVGLLKPDIATAVDVRLAKELGVVKPSDLFKEQVFAVKNPHEWQHLLDVVAKGKLDPTGGGSFGPGGGFKL